MESVTVNEQTQVEQKANSFASAFIMRGFLVIIIGLFAGTILARSNTVPFGDSEFSWSTALFWYISCGISGVAFLGFAEIIKLLDSINKKLK